jgi:hypothetical protein
MAFALTRDEVVVLEMHRRKTYVRKPLFTFPYGDVVHVSTEREGRHVVGFIELTQGRDLKFSAKRRGTDAESVFDSLRTRARIARANPVVLD